MATIAVLGTLDTKGREHAFLAERIRERGHEALLIDVGSRDQPTVTPDITRQQVADAAGIDLADLRKRMDRGESVGAMARAASVLLPGLLASGRIDGVISLGGGGGTSIATAAMRSLPIGFPKLMVSTLAGTNTAAYLGTKDIVMFPSIVDVAGLNRLSELLFTRAAGAICGMVEMMLPLTSSKPLVVASMFGNTTDCVNAAKEVLENAGYEVLVFHATGTGGRAMESLIESGMVAGVLDVTTTELADELLGGILSAGPNRLRAAAAAEVPTVIAPGCLDMANFGPIQSVPQHYQSRNLYVHNPDITLLRTTPDECRQLGRQLAEKANAYRGPVAILIPDKAISVISAEGGPFHDRDADRALFDAIRETAQCEVISMDLDINDAPFAHACANKLLALMKTA